MSQVIDHAAEYTIALEGVTYTYPGTDIGVHDINLGIRPGELLAVIGPSGCGKSTLLKIIAGFVQPSHGRVIIGGKDAVGIPPRLRDIGIVFQTYTLFPHMLVWENVAYPLKLRGQDEAARKAKALDILDRVGLNTQANKLPGQLSGGQQQRVALARAMALKPEILLLDEVTAALDPELVYDVLESIRVLAREGMTMLIVSHEMAFVREISSRVVFMAEGKVVETGTPREIFESPTVARTRDFIGKILRH